jgi:hypothetical protein
MVTGFSFGPTFGGSGGGWRRTQVLACSGRLLQYHLPGPRYQWALSAKIIALKLLGPGNDQLVA